MKRYRLTGMLDARGIEPDEGGMLVLYQDHAELLAAIRAALETLGYPVPDALDENLFPTVPQP